jgi:serine/threonine protein kinase
MALTYTNGDEPVPGYRLVEPLGQGGFGAVWKAVGPGGVPAAVKIINLTAKHAHKELRAIQRVKQIRHPNLVPINGVWLKSKEGKILDETALDPATPGSSLSSSSIKGTMVVSHQTERPKPTQLIIAMGLGDKQLADRMQECQELGLPGIPPVELLDYMEAAARGIDHLNSPKHPGETGLVAIQHCDIKPHNIMIVSGVAQVCDFGLARVLGEAPTLAAATYAYGAPEFLRDQRPSNGTDQYSLAITYIELRTGFLPFTEDDLNPLGIYNAHVEGKLDYSKVAPGEVQVLKRATALKAEERYPTTMDFVRALRRACERKSGVLLIKPGSEIVPGFKLVRQLVASEHDEVWEATAPGGRHKALVLRKLAPDEAKIQLKALNLIANFGHPHLTEHEAYWLLDPEGSVIPEEMWEQPEGGVISMLVIAGKLATRSLQDRLGECRRASGEGLPSRELLGYMRQLAGALDFMNTPQHQLGGRTVSIQHRDVRPVNIVFHGTSVKLGNFALARTIEGTSTAMPGDHGGLNVSYAAPETFDDRVTRWTDQYSLAITYFHMRTGEMPFRSNCSPTELREIHRQGRLDLSPLPESERAVIARATSVIPDQRFASCSEMTGALERAIGLPEDVPQMAPDVIQRESDVMEHVQAFQPIADVSREPVALGETPRPAAPFGWTYGTGGRIVEHPLEQEVIRLVSQLRAAGRSPREILDVLEIYVSPSEGPHATSR